MAGGCARPGSVVCIGTRCPARAVSHDREDLTVLDDEKSPSRFPARLRAARRRPGALRHEKQARLVDNPAPEQARKGMFPSYRQGNRSVFARRRCPSLTLSQTEPTEPTTCRPAEAPHATK